MPWLNLIWFIMTNNTKNFIAKVVIVLGLIASFNFSLESQSASSYKSKTAIGSYVLQPMALVGDN